MDGAGNIYVADTYNHTIRKITSARVVSTFAGTAGIHGATDGTGSAAQFNTPTDITVNSAGTLLYVADYGNNEIRKITSSRVVSTFAGSVSNPPGGVGYVDGTGRAARFGNPIGIGLAGTTIYVADDNHTIRKITSAGVVTRVAGTPTSLAALMAREPPHNSTIRMVWPRIPKATSTWPITATAQSAKLLLLPA